MNYSINEYYERFIQEQISLGNFKSESEVIQAGLQLIEARDRKKNQLSEHIRNAISEGGAYSDEEIEEILKLS